MASLVLTGDTSGQVTIAAPAVAGTNTITLAAQTGTLNVAGPAFSVYKSGQQTFSANTWTKVTWDTEQFDTNNNFDNVTNYRFTPTVAGYYQINASIFLSYSATAPSIIQTAIYKNGSGYRSGYSANAGGTAYGPYGAFEVSDVVFLNGSTDYVEIYVWSNSASAFVNNSVGSVPTSFVSGVLVRSA